MGSAAVWSITVKASWFTVIDGRGDDPRGDEARGDEARGDDARGDDARGDDARDLLLDLLSISEFSANE